MIFEKIIEIAKYYDWESIFRGSLYLKFNENGSVQTMKDGEILEIVNRQLTPENTMSIYCNDAIIDDSFSKKYRLPFKIRKIKNSYYLFLQADSLKMPTLDEICYVYKKS